MKATISSHTEWLLNCVSNPNDFLLLVPGGWGIRLLSLGHLIVAGA